MKIAAVDHGSRRIGLAISDDLGMFAHPAGVIEAAEIRAQVREVARRLADAGVSRVIVGLPKNMDGGEGPAAATARDFAERLRAAAAIEVLLVDERLSTVEAARRMHEGGVDARRQKSRIDAAAAVLILQGYLDSAPASLENRQAPPPDAT